MGVTGAGANGEARIFWEGWVGLGELAEEELGTFAGFDEAGVPAVGAEAKLGIGGGRCFGGGHKIFEQP